MHLYIWRHSKNFSSWSMLDEPHIHQASYLSADVTVLAASKEQALDLLAEEGVWNREDLLRLEPEVIELKTPRIIIRHVSC